MDDLMRLLDVVRRELGADDARLEVGGRDPSEDVVWCRVEDEYRLVVVFDETPSQTPEALRDRLRMIVAGFASTLHNLPRPRRRLDPQGALDDALDVLALQTTARDALVVDDNSPVIWGTSISPRGIEELSDAVQGAEGLTLANAAGLDLAAVLAGEVREELPTELAQIIAHLKKLESGHDGERDREDWARRLRAFAAMVALRQMIEEAPTGSRFSVRDPDLAFLARHFAGIYWLVLVFEDASFSELHAEAAMIHALPWIDRLVEALPPFDPGGGGGRVVRLRQLRPV